MGLDADPGRPAGDAGPPVVVLGGQAHDDQPSADEVRAREAHDIAGLVTRAVREGWRTGSRALTLADITILVPTRRSIDGLEQALDAAGVAYRTEAATFVYSALEVRELLRCARAVDDPTDELAAVATLRAPMFGCSDAELWRWKAAGGCSRPPLRFVVDQARAWSEAERGSLREYLNWAAGQAEDRARVTETVLPETDTDAVRITTIHAAKGLEFPFVIVGGLGSPGSTQRPPVLWPADGGCELKLGGGLTTLGYAEADAVEQQIEDCEDRRLLYVAATRAQSHLAVSLHRTGRDCPAETLAQACAGVEHECWSAPAEIDPLAAAPRPPAEPLPAWHQWAADRNLAVANGARRGAESATDIAHGQAATELSAFARHGLAKQPRDLELPAWAKGRYGTAIGRALHAVLQSIDLASGAGVDELAEAQALAEGVPDEAGGIAAATRAALGSPTVQRAVACPQWRETYVGTVVDDTLVEGYVDLLYRDHDGLVLVDYKTDAAAGADALAAYETQLLVYARAIADATGEQVVRSVLLFVRPGTAVEHVVAPSSQALGTQPAGR